MKRLKMIYAVMLAVIYVAATALSSLAVLTCDHPHHIHIYDVVAHCDCTEGHHHHYHCHHEDHSTSHAFGKECCDHTHTLLGEHHTQIIVEKQRGDDAVPMLYALNTPALIAENIYTNPYIPVRVGSYHGYEQVPLEAAFSRYDSLRAPPQLS